MCTALKKKPTLIQITDSYSALHEGRPVVLVVGGWANDGVVDSNGIGSQDKSEMLDYTQTNSAWEEGNKKTKFKFLESFSFFDTILDPTLTKNLKMLRVNPFSINLSITDLILFYSSFLNFQFLQCFLLKLVRVMWFCQLLLVEPI